MSQQIDKTTGSAATSPKSAQPAASGQATNPPSKGPNLADIMEGILGDDAGGQAAPPPESGSEGEGQGAEAGDQRPEVGDQKPETEGQAAEGEGQGAKGKEQGAEGEKGDEDDEAERKGWSASVQRKVDKLTKRLRTAEDELDSERQRAQSLEERLEQSGAQPKNQVPSTGLENLSAQTLDNVEASARMLIQSIPYYLKGKANAAQQARVEQYAQAQGLDNDGLELRRGELMELVSQWVPQRRQQLAKDAEQAAEFKTEEAKFNTQADQIFPFWKDRDSKDYNAAQNVVKLMPEIKRLPHWRIIAGTYLLGLKQLQAIVKAKEPATAPPASLPPKTPVRASGQAVPRDGKGNAQRNALVNAARKGNPDAVTAYLETVL
jgi:hypothetical protein